MKSAQQLRARANKALVRARAGDPEMRRYAQKLLHQARKNELTALSMRLGRKNVTPEAYRAFVRERRDEGGFTSS